MKKPIEIVKKDKSRSTGDLYNEARQEAKEKGWVQVPRTKADVKITCIGNGSQSTIYFRYAILILILVIGFGVYSKVKAQSISGTRFIETSENDALYLGAWSIKITGDSVQFDFDRYEVSYVDTLTGIWQKTQVSLPDITVGISRRRENKARTLLELDNGTKIRIAHKSGEFPGIWWICDKVSLYFYGIFSFEIL